jgi:hypothetical protein
MFKLAITLVVIIALSNSGDAQNSTKLDCNSDDLPDMLEKTDQCAAEDKVEAILNKFSAQNQIIAKQFISEMKSLEENTFETATSNVIANQTSLLAQLQAADINGYNAFNALIASSNVSQNCTEKANGLKAFMNTLNPQGEVIVKKIGCFIMTDDVMENAKAIMEKLFLKNTDNFDLLKAQESRNMNLLMGLLGIDQDKEADERSAVMAATKNLVIPKVITRMNKEN